MKRETSEKRDKDENRERERETCEKRDKDEKKDREKDKDAHLDHL